ncbi:hypothetical protein [Dongia sedimenti]|uniref:DUF995 domain-containing protein n=1 Tax=Dongia sedimenti TaxID=3064282 RepID=A0ABU0YJK6_9PROT|nr:hypothetical protein [Rhodospirillaceae bacterium R-7]
MFNKFALAALGAVALLASVPAEAKSLRGDAFITAMQGNTLTGKMGNGTPYKLYFLPGGQATIQEGTAEPVSGTWSLDKSGDVCLKWPGAVASEDGCYRVEVVGHKVTWSNKDGSQKARLFGGVAPLDMSKSE